MVTNRNTRRYVPVRQQRDGIPSLRTTAILTVTGGKLDSSQMKNLTSGLTSGVKQAFAGVALTLVFAGSATSADNFSIEVNNESIAVEASNASLKELLQELEKLTGIPVKFVADTSERVTLSVGLTSIENAIGKITPNHMIVHDEQEGKKVIKELIIIPDSGGTNASGSSFLPSGEPAPAIEPAAPIATPTDAPIPVTEPSTIPAPGDMPIPDSNDRVN